jgi:hypothetical protein
MAFSLGPTDKKYISAFGIDKRDWLPQVLDINNDEYLTDIMDIAGRYKLAVVPHYEHFVDDAIFILLDTTGATVLTSGTPSVTTAFTAATSGYARQGDLIKFPDGKVGMVKSVVNALTLDTVVIQSVDGTNITHTAGQKLSVFSDVFGEKSSAPMNRKFGQTQYTNKIQIFREVNEETDVQMASEVELEFNGSHYVINREMAIKALQVKAMINGAIIGGRMSVTSHSDASPALVDKDGGSVQTTRGLDQYITTYGIVDTVATPGTWTLADLNDVIYQLVANRTTKRYLVLRGTKAAIPMDMVLKGLNSGISAGKLSLDGKNHDFMVTGFQYANFDFQFGTIGILDNQEFFSQTDIVKSIYFVPKDGVKTKTGGTQPRIQMRYQPHNIKNSIGDEYIAQWDTGALARTGPTSDEAILRTNWISHQGLEVLGAQHFAKSTMLA